MNDEIHINIKETENLLNSINTNDWDKINSQLENLYRLRPLKYE